jgi:ABC-type branched-subunit amino acid transport system substrate-binding protein
VRSLILTVLLAFCACARAAEPAPIVLGQSIAEGRGSYRGTLGLIGGLRAYVGHVNATGGISGRPIKVVTLVGDADPASHAENVRKLVREHGAVAIIGCAGEAVCQGIATAAAEMHVPLIGALSGQDSMGHDRSPYLFPLRASYQLEALALAQQIATLGITRAALISDGGANGPRVEAVRRALQGQRIALKEYQVSLRDEAALKLAVDSISKDAFQTVVIDVLPDTLDALVERGLKERAGEWPSIVTSLASSSFQGIGNVFPTKVLGFTQLVPNPDSDSLELARQFQQHAEKYASSKAISFEGMATYIAARVTVQALRAAGQQASGDKLAAALAAADGFDVAGERLSFAKGRAWGTDRVSVGLRSRDGAYLK